MKSGKTIEHILNCEIDEILCSLYGESAVAFQRERYAAAVGRFAALYGEDREISLFSVSGRSELSGNHTDHNGGRVIAAAIAPDILVVASPREDRVISLKSEGFPADRVEIDSYLTPRDEGFGTSAALIAGTCKGFCERGYVSGGFDAYTTSSVPKGSGLSSSAAFEVAVGTVLNHFYNGGRVDAIEIAKIAQYAENVFFGKPSGLMDQMACSVGGVITVDFADEKNPAVEKLTLPAAAEGYRLYIVNTGGNHADLTPDYAAVPAEMKAVARELGVSLLCFTSEEALMAEISRLRESVGDRAILRALHFFAENRRVDRQKKALAEGDFDAFLREVKASGISSFCYLQNVYTNKNVTEQGLSLALRVADRVLDGEGASRVHGGGFAGTVQAFVPVSLEDEFRNEMEAVFGKDSCLAAHIRPEGAKKIL